MHIKTALYGCNYFFVEGIGKMKWPNVSWLVTCLQRAVGSLG